MTPNPAKAHRFEVKLDGVKEVFWIQFGWSAMAEIEAEAGATDREALAEALNKKSFGGIISVFHAGMRKHHPDLTDSEIADIMDELGFEGTQTVMVKALAKAFGVRGDKDDDESPPSAAPNRKARRAASKTS
jgi:hypothetical protein